MFGRSRRRSLGSANAAAPPASIRAVVFRRSRRLVIPRVPTPERSSERSRGAVPPCRLGDTSDPRQPGALALRRMAEVMPLAAGRSFNPFPDAIEVGLRFAALAADAQDLDHHPRTPRTVRGWLPDDRRPGRLLSWWLARTGGIGLAGDGRRGTRHRRVRLRDRRRRHRRLRARQSAVGGSARLGPAGRGRRQGRLPLDSHPGRLPLHPEQSAHRLVPHDRGRARARRARARLSARQGFGRLLLDQRHDLHARPGGRLRPLAPAGLGRLGLGRRAAVLQEVRGPRPRARRGAWGGRRVAGRGDAHLLGDPGCLPRGGGRGRHPQDHRLQSRRQRGLRLLPGQPAARRALEHGEGVPAAGALAPEPHGPDPRPGDPDRARRAARGRPGGPPGGRYGPRRGAGRAGARERRDRLAAAPAALGHRAGRAAAGRAASHPGTSCQASARTCRTICSCAWSTRSRARGRSTSAPRACWRAAGWASSTSCSGAGR